MARTPERSGAGKRDHNSLKAKIEISLCQGDHQLTQETSPSHTHTHTHTPFKRYSTDPPCQESAGFRPKAPQQMLFSVEDMARCQAVCKHNRGRVAALIKLFIHIIILRRVQTSHTKLLGVGDVCAVGLPGGWGGASGAAKMSSQPGWWLFIETHGKVTCDQRPRCSFQPRITEDI